MHLLPVFAQDDQDLSVVYRYVLELTEQEWAAQLADALLVRSLRIALIILVAYAVNRVVRRVIKRSIRRLAAEGGMSMLGTIRSKTPLADTSPMDIGRLTMRAETIAGVFRSIATAAIWATAFVMVLAEFNVNLGPLIAGAGIIGVALGFGSQRLVQDFLSGIFMLIEDQYGIGDIVDAGEAIGVIEAITLRSTRIRDLEGTVWHIPNGQITRIGNMSQQWARALLDIGVAYDTDLPTAIDVIKRTADDLWQDPDWSALVLEEPAVWGVNDFGASEIIIRLVVKTLPGEQWTVGRELRKRLKAAFDAEGIEIPFPQRTVWVRDDNGAEAQGAFQPAAQHAAAASSRHATPPRGAAQPEAPIDPETPIDPEEMPDRDAQRLPDSDGGEP